MSQGLYWILTIPHADFLPYLPPGVQYIRGQLEASTLCRPLADDYGADAGYLHWQLLVAFTRKCRLAVVTRTFGAGIHAELSRSSAANDYVWKEDTRVGGTQFELGKLAFKRNSATDWSSVRDSAKRGRLDDIPSDIYVRCYNQLKRIACDHMQADPMEREVVCYWGRSGSGKSRRAWEESGVNAYPKDPRSKFWDGYRGQEHVVLDEFRGGIDIAHVLRWFDRYPVLEGQGELGTLICKEDLDHEQHSP
ncbi:replication associated protein [Lake Sarah-associated circular virus-30]|uniref:replication associated protein n=1 Tax=Lake Sarah-associated circular virus-30 TaxID=1685758 RepID=UPI000777D456|nr:replication associated protein [Lake Sarah-associated circular virus-30]ALE29706.1 replication associated protein [Lake Sarah-associated circular virus-30]ALE29708.1 replication associated protein [Lake Sarah-associated circular virus-30]